MKNLNMERAISRYNDIMWNCGYEHSTINTKLSENTENWNLRDMIAEADYLLSCYYETGNVRCDDRFLGEEEYKIWRSETGMLKRFIDAYKPFVENMICTENHCSNFDNAIK